MSDSGYDVSAEREALLVQTPDYIAADQIAAVMTFRQIDDFLRRCSGDADAEDVTKQDAMLLLALARRLMRN